MELVYVLVLEAKFCEFESHHPHQFLCLVSSVVERLLYTERVGSSKLSRGTMFIAGRSGDPNSLISCLEGGSNPSPATKF